jgi:hypothetical protein
MNFPAAFSVILPFCQNQDLQDFRICLIKTKSC